MSLKQGGNQPRQLERTLKKVGSGRYVRHRFLYVNLRHHRNS